MIFIGDSKVDLSSSELVDVVQSGYVGDVWQWPPPTFTGYSKSSAKPFVLGPLSAAIDVPWTVIQYWSLLDKGQEINKFTIETTAFKKIKIDATFILYFANGLSQDAQTRIEKAFEAYNFSEGEADSYAENFIKLNPDISPFAFGCCHNYDIEILTDEKLDESKENFIKLWLKENYSIRLIRSDAMKSERKEVRGPNELVCPKNGDTARAKPPKKRNRKSTLPQETLSTSTLQDGNLLSSATKCDPLLDVENDMKKEAENNGCLDNQISTWEVTWTEGIPATRWQWGWHTIKIGCVSFDFYYCEFQSCATEYHLIASASIPKSIILYEQSIKNCIENSALAAAVFTIVFTDFASGLIAFKALFWLCIKNKFIDPLPCLDGEIYVETIYIGNWH